VNAGGPGSAASLVLDALERRSLLRAAREAIAARLTGQQASLPPLKGGLAAARGAFVTLLRASDGGLRGCVGHLEADAPLLEIVTRMAVAAATRDGRFDPVTAGDFAASLYGDSAWGYARGHSNQPAAPLRRGATRTPGRT